MEILKRGESFVCSGLVVENGDQYLVHSMYSFQFSTLAVWIPSLPEAMI